MSNEAILAMLSNWGKLNADIKELREDQLKSLINYEISTKARATFVERLHQRYCMLRDARERAELLGGQLL